MIKHYKKDDIEIVWDSSKCSHSTRCFHGLPEVFNPAKRPWISTEGADKASIESQVSRCPSGALSVKKS